MHPTAGEGAKPSRVTLQRPAQIAPVSSGFKRREASVGAFCTTGQVTAALLVSRPSSLLNKGAGCCCCLGHACKSCVQHNTASARYKIHSSVLLLYEGLLLMLGDVTLSFASDFS